ncbi:MAG TPA: mechanosensitive ion channel domain-containing protein, partial [Bryobacteraceae bacterium]|nr:mechanosensitive ion channel domain-containing protein [Bryobacteraceae bacterium]
DVRETPRGALLGFLDAAREGDFRRASSFLNVRREHRRTGAPEQLARQLKEVLDRELAQDPARLSNAPEGDLADGLEPNQELLAAIRQEGREIELYLERVPATPSGQIWLISSATVSLIPMLRARAEGHAMEKYLPAWMLKAGAFDTRIWQWLALVLLTLAALPVGHIFARALIRALQPIVRRTHSQLDDTLVASIRSPVQLLIALIAYRIGIVWIAPSYLLRTYLGRILTGLIYLAIAWVFVRIIDVVTNRIVAAMSRRQKTTAASVMPLTRRTLKAAAVIFALLATLTSWGYDTTALLAGLGVGGLAVALAAQKTIENLFGGVAITSDKPVLVGDFCRFGNKTGTVEDIGLRSTRLRTVDRTVVTVPNGEFSSLQIENFGKRDKMSFRPVLQLERDTTPEQLRRILPRLERMLKDHPKVEQAARVRFIAISPQSLDVEVYTYVLTPDYDEFLVLQQELLLHILEIITEEGAALAVPRQHLLLDRAATRSSTPQS